MVAPRRDETTIEGVRIAAVPPSSGRLARMTITVWHVYRAARQQRADIYLFQDPELVPMALLLRLRGAKVVYDIRELLDLQFLTKEYLPPWARRICGKIVGILQKFAVPRLSATLVATPSIQDQLEPASTDRVVVVQNFPSLADLPTEACRPWSLRQPWAVYVGRITFLRGAREMLAAMALLPEPAGVSLKIAGEFDSARVRDEMSQLPGSQRTDYLGVLNRSEIWSLLAQARFGLVTLHPSAAHYGAWPVKLFEFMYAGIPVIASDFPLWREIIDQAGCGLLVDPLDPAAIAQAIEYLRTHPDEAEAMGRRGRHAVEARYNWEREEAKLQEIFGRLAVPPLNGQRFHTLSKT